MTDDTRNNNNDSSNSDPLQLGKAALEELNVTIDKHNSQTIRTKKGGFVKGISGNPKGRPKKDKPQVINQNDIEDRTSVDPTVFGKDAKAAMEHLLSTAKTRSEAAKYAKELLSYQYPKKASIETKNENYQRIEFHMVLPEMYEELQSIYKQDPKVVDQMSEEDIKQLASPTADMQELYQSLKEKDLSPTDEDK